MSRDRTFFYDSYAVLAYISGEKAYTRYFEEKSSGALTKLNLMEIYFRVGKLHGHEAARQIIDRFSRYLVDFDIDDIAGSMKLREDLMKKRKDISYVDALGYYLAKKMQIPFLTGDRHFKELEGVMFVK
ncbi:PIN domain-containing protein [Nitrososphaera sp.]|uniref:PIN domain-containing protein n=1 Tax=Nitrososphaera sp. TaxID=1971748 RepID=UPI001842CDA1|nr:PIN domain-containing protein [Nitrososphaera sp.]NWG36448.1 PIN domain-containing protein [Nitrososphaera sp.]